LAILRDGGLKRSRGCDLEKWRGEELERGGEMQRRNEGERVRGVEV
jgi:hypothetical protein